MGILVEKTKIGDVDVETAQFAPRVALKRLRTIMSLIGGPLSDLLKGLPVAELKKGLEADTDAMLGGLGPAISTLIGAMTDEVIDKTIIPLLDCTRVDIFPVDSPDKFDAAFSGRMGILPAVIIFVLKVNYTDFFVGLVSSAASALPKKKEKKEDKQSPLEKMSSE